MHNWWLATLEHAGILTHEEAKHISEEIRNAIHKENYDEAFRELGTILDKKDFVVNRVAKLETDLKQLVSKVESIKQPTVSPGPAKDLQTK